ncbi:MAG TPA: class I SAM-dependent methyltransferase, partial [Acidimicrobiales bacterium]|nr:class I SAM-dependent methyltransferase [Acidimicrobiales bacterium]
MALFAVLYDPVMALADRAGLARLRRRLVAEARGRVLEVGSGTGRNLALYRDVEAVVALEPDDAMRDRLLRRIPAAAVPVEVHDAGLGESGLADASFDTVVSTLVLCSVDDQDAVLGEIRRLLKPDGQFLFLEHVRSPGLWGTLEAAVTPVWRRLAGGCHLDRRTLQAMRAAGLAITDCQRSGLLVRGVARPARHPVL